jgi:hypothetical protein
LSHGTERDTPVVDDVVRERGDERHTEADEGRQRYRERADGDAEHRAHHITFYPACAGWSAYTTV